MTRTTRAVAHDPGRGSRRRQGWTAVAWAILVAGTVASLAGGQFWRSSVSSQADKTFTRAAAGVSGSLATQLQREGDLTATVGALVTSQPNLDNVEFAEWVAAQDAGERYRYSSSFGFVQRVPAAELTAFINAEYADPPGA